MENKIRLKEKNVLRFKVEMANGEDTGLEVKIDLQDIELPLRINKMEQIHKKNLSLLKQKAQAIEKQEDKKGKYLLSWKEEENTKLLREFYENEEKALDMLIGQGMTKKMLKAMDRYPYYDMFDDIVQALEPVFNEVEKEAHNMYDEAKNMIDGIKEKYGDINNGNVI